MTAAMSTTNVQGIEAHAPRATIFKPSPVHADELGTVLFKKTG